MLEYLDVISDLRYSDNRRSGAGPYTYIETVGSDVVSRLWLSKLLDYKGSPWKCVFLSGDLRWCAEQTGHA